MAMFAVPQNGATTKGDLAYVCSDSQKIKGESLVFLCASTWFVGQVQCSLLGLEHSSGTL